jgi:predicted esterase
MNDSLNRQGPHHGGPVLSAGLKSTEAKAAMILVHGRGASAEDILSLVPEIHQQGFTYLAPQAAGNTWYPYSFLMSLEQNEPGISSGLNAIASLLNQLENEGIPNEQTILLGFSQGACLALEFAARNARRYGGVIALSGGLIGPPGTQRNYPNSLAGTPIFLGCSDTDLHIPKGRVIESKVVLENLGAKVTTRLYPNMGHTINRDELDHVQEIMNTVLATASQ